MNPTASINKRQPEQELNILEPKQASQDDMLLTDHMAYIVTCRNIDQVITYFNIPANKINIPTSKDPSKFHKQDAILVGLNVLKNRVDRGIAIEKDDLLMIPSYGGLRDKLKELLN